MRRGLLSRSVLYKLGLARAVDRNKMLNQRWVLLLIFAVIIVGATGAGIRYYLSKCHGIDACAASEAESHERDKPEVPQ